MENKKIIIIGGVAAGTKAASRARRLDSNSEITIFTDEPYISYAGCGEPYYIGGVIEEEAKLFARQPEVFKDQMNIDIKLNHRAVSINPNDKNIIVKNLGNDEEITVPYDKLVIATGASPIVPPLPGVDLPGIFTIRAIDELRELKNKVNKGKVKKAVVVGGGYIGLEMAENLKELGIEVTVVEMGTQLAPTFDHEVAAAVKKTLMENGVEVLTDTKVQSFIGTKDIGVMEVVTDKGKINTDLVIMAVGIKPNTEIAKEAGIELGVKNAISVNNRCQTNFPDIYAGGDCAETTLRITGKPVWIALGSVANRIGRVIGTNIAGGDETFDGVLGTSIFKAFNMNFAQTGLTERSAKQEGFDVLVSTISAMDKPHYMPGYNFVALKLVFEKSTTKLLGAQVWSEGNVDKPIDTLAAALTFGATAKDLSQIDLAYAPPYAPALGNVNVAGNVALNLFEKKTENITQKEFHDRKTNNDDSILFLDVRNPDEVKNDGIVCKSAEFIPFPRLKERCSDITEKSDNKEVIVSCLTSVRAASAYRMLKNNGCKSVKYLDGSSSIWPYGELE